MANIIHPSVELSIYPSPTTLSNAHSPLLIIIAGPHTPTTATASTTRTPTLLLLTTLSLTLLTPPPLSLLGIRREFTGRRGRISSLLSSPTAPTAIPLLLLLVIALDMADRALVLPGILHIGIGIDSSGHRPGGVRRV